MVLNSWLYFISILSLLRLAILHARNLDENMYFPL